MSSAIVSLALGCVRPRFAVVAPAEAAGVLPIEGSKQFEADGLLVSIQMIEDRAVLGVVNRGDEPIDVTADSRVMDSKGRAFDLPGRRVAPGMIYRVLVPPRVVPRVIREPVEGPSVGSTDTGGLIVQSGHSPESVVQFNWPRGRTVEVILVYIRGESQNELSTTLRREQ
jgi:hypothetical protein